MLRFSDIVFGPIKSRRLGSSLGINLLPREGKLCNFDCIYCECGWNKDGREGDRTLPKAEDVRAALDAKLRECLAEGTPIDSITFSGNGEPTVNPDFPEIIDIVLEMRDRWYPKAVVSVLSNATMLGDEKVFAALRKIDNPILKIDAVSDEKAKMINRPSCNWHLDTIIRNLERFEGDFVLQTMLLKGAGFDVAEKENMNAWMDIVRRLHPREVMVYTLDREAPMKGLSKYTVEEMAEMTAPLTEEGFKVQIRG